MKPETRIPVTALLGSAILHAVVLLLGIGPVTDAPTIQELPASWIAITPVAPPVARSMTSETPLPVAPTTPRPEPRRPRKPRQAPTATPPAVADSVIPEPADTEPTETVQPREEPTSLPLATPDLLARAPGKARIMVVLRMDRLRTTPYAKPIEEIMANAPDYQSLFAHSGLAVTDNFDAIVIATPDWSQPSATFLGAKSRLELSAFQDLLDGDPKQPRVTWAASPEGPVGTRAPEAKPHPADTRVILFPTAEWMLVAHPDQLAGEAAWPARLQELSRSGEAAVLIETTDFGKTLSVGSYEAPAPTRATLAATLHAAGADLTANLEFSDAARARAFVLQAEQAQRGARDVVMRVLLDGLHLRRAVEQLAMVHVETRVVVSTSISTSDAKELLGVGAAWAKAYFMPQPTRGRP